jgi:glycosidase
MGVDILWLMPVHPIGRKNRKGGLGSAYAVRDYLAINPDYGSAGDFRRLVEAAHALGLKVMLDWVANHTAWDHGWVEQHPDWYLKNAAGEIHSYTYSAGHEPEYWTDVIGLDYTVAAVHDAMATAMAWWVREMDVDGFRCDVASLVPTAFWERVRPELDAIKPVFMLAESADAGLLARAFDMVYDWSLHDVMKQIARGDLAGAQACDALDLWLATRSRNYPVDAYHLCFTSNHDKNAWEGHDGEVYGPAFEAMAVLAATLPGMPLVYGGQEAWFEKRLKFFEKDPIAWGSYRLGDFYSRLLTLKRSHPELDTGPADGKTGGTLDFLKLGTEAVVAYTRRLADRQLAVIVNLSAQAQTFGLIGRQPQTLAPWAWTLETR